MSSTKIHLAQNGTADASFEDGGLRLSMTPLSDPTEILRRMPAQAVSPALLEMLALLASPILLITQSSAAELREARLSEPVLAQAA